MATSQIRGLHVFCALIETGSATAAAQRLGMSQPAVSQQISRLESNLRLTLFVRENGRMRPTETALSMYDEASRAFDGLNRVLDMARDNSVLELGFLRVAAPHSLSGTYLPRALALLAADSPRLRISIHLGTYERIVSLVAAREVDLGLAKAPVLSPGIESIDICSSGLVTVTSTTHRLAKKKTVTLSDLEHEPLIMIGRGRMWRDEIDLAFRQVGMAPLVAVETHSVESACGFAAEGFGTAIAPAWLAKAMARDDIIVKPIEIGIEHRFLVVYPARSQLRKLATDFAACIASVQAASEQT
jgi:DNA-binding transcriptional LysR family regulator